MNKRICVAIICCVAAVGCQPNKRDVKKEFYGNGQVKTIDSIDAVAHIVTRYGYDERGHYVSYCRYVNDSADGIFYSTIGTVDRVTKIRYFKGGLLNGASIDIDMNGDTLDYELYENGQMVYQKQYSQGKAIRLLDFKNLAYGGIHACYNSNKSEYYKEYM